MPLDPKSRIPLITRVDTPPPKKNQLWRELLTSDLVFYLGLFIIAYVLFTGYSLIKRAITTTATPAKATAAEVTR